MGNIPAAPAHKALTATQLIASLAKTDGWKLHGDGADLAIEKTFVFSSYLKVMAFANAVAYMAEQRDHHPSLLVQWGSCSVRFNTHDVGGISQADFECAGLVDALVQH
jgi:4a-hydroxytetrahydrobiopterin dehydratase